MKVLHVAASMSQHWGGPVTVVAQLTQSLMEQGVTSSVFAASGKRVGDELLNVDGVEVRAFPTGPLSPIWTAHAPAMIPAMREALQDHDLIHIHELWHYPAYAASEVARDLHKPYIVTVHGGLDPWALNHKALKKRIYMILAQRRVLSGASGIHAITSAEEKQIRENGFEAPVAVIPNGINADVYDRPPENPALSNRYPQLKDKKVILFLSRVHPKKGLDILAEAFGRIARNRDDVHLLIAGPDESGYRQQVESMLRERGVLGHTTFLGMVTGSDKLAVLASSDVFVLPSYSEGFSMAVLEAMASGLPVVISNQCYFPEVSENGAGLVIDTDADQLHDSLTQLIDDPDKRHAMGSRGGQLVRDSYTWDSVAAKMTNFYRKSVGSMEPVLR